MPPLLFLVPFLCAAQGLTFYEKSALENAIAACTGPDVCTGWDVSAITDMSYLCRNDKCEYVDVTGWDTSGVTNMKYIFFFSTTFNQNISAWNTGNVENMASMFSSTESFNQDISAWDTSKVTNMEAMFSETIAFNQDISAWDTSSVTNMNSMFSYTTAFNQDISSWDTSSVTDMGSLFEAAVSFNQDVSSWDTTSLTYLNYMFYYAEGFDQSVTFDTSGVSDPQNVFTASGMSESNMALTGNASGGLFHPAPPPTPLPPPLPPITPLTEMENGVKQKWGIDPHKIKGLKNAVAGGTLIPKEVVAEFSKRVPISSIEGREYRKNVAALLLDDIVSNNATYVRPEDAHITVPRDVLFGTQPATSQIYAKIFTRETLHLNCTVSDELSWETTTMYALIDTNGATFSVCSTRLGAAQTLYVKRLDETSFEVGCYDGDGVQGDELQMNTLNEGDSSECSGVEVTLGSGTFEAVTPYPSPPPPPPPHPDSANGQADPHIRFAHGGEADFRGVNGTHYVLLSFPNLSFTGRTLDAVFQMHDLLVNGSFFSEVAWTIATRNGTYNVLFVAKRFWCMYTCPTLTPAESQERPDVLVTNDRGFRLGIGKRTAWETPGLRVRMEYHTLTVVFKGWEMKATRRPVYGWRSGPTWRIDFRIALSSDKNELGTLRLPQKEWPCFPHGIVGQSFDGDDLKTDGKKDDYNTNGSMTTSAMAEGAIEGTAQDYAVSGPFDTHFAYSRFYKTKCASRSLKGLRISRKVKSNATASADVASY